MQSVKNNVPGILKQVTDPNQPQQQQPGQNENKAIHANIGKKNNLFNALTKPKKM